MDYKSKNDITSRDLILTVSIGQDELAEYTIPRMQRYAQSHDVDFQVMTQSDLFSRPVFAYWEMLFSLSESEYDRILILDSDILIRRDAPNIFDVPFGSVAMKASGYVADPFLVRVHNEIAGDFTVPDMYNTGVILISREYLASIIDPIREYSKTVESTRFADQIYFCVVVKRSGVVPTPLSWRWNQHDDVPNYRAELAHFLHFRGPDKTRRVKRFLKQNMATPWQLGYPSE